MIQTLGIIFSLKETYFKGVNMTNTDVSMLPKWETNYMDLVVFFLSCTKMAIYVTITKCEKIRLEMTLTDPNLSCGGWNNFSFFNQLSNLNLLSHGSVKKEYPGFGFSVSRQFGAQWVSILMVFLLLKTYKDIWDDSQS